MKLVGWLLVIGLVLRTSLATLSDNFRQHLANNHLLELPDVIVDEKKSWPSRISFRKILKEFVNSSITNHFVINLGAQDGDNYDPVFEMLIHEKNNNHHYSGIFVEAKHAHEKNLLRNVRHFNMTGKMLVFIEYALPETIVSRLQSVNCPLEPDVFKIDIDSVDYPVLETLLRTSSFRPKVIMAEINSDIPLPLMWYQKEVRKIRGETYFGNYGMSVYSLYDLMDSYGYVPVAVELGSRRGNCVVCEHNMFFIKKELYQYKTNYDDTYDISFLDFSRSFWMNLLRYSRYARSKVPSSQLKYLQPENYAVSCVQLYLDRCPYSLMQRYGQLQPQFQNRSFYNWKTWYDLQTFLMQTAGNDTAVLILKKLNAEFTRLDKKSRSTTANMIYIKSNALVPSI